MNPRRVASNFLLSGLLFCSLCGSPLNGHVIATSKNKKRWEYYICSRRSRRKDCSATQVPRRAIENAVLDELRTRILAPENLANIQSEMRRQQEEQDANYQGELESLNRSLAGLRKQIDNVTKAIAEIGHSRSLLEKLHELEGNEAQLQFRASTMRPRVLPFLGEDPSDLSARLLGIFETSDPEQLKRILGNFIHKITVERQGDRIWGKMEHYLPEIKPPSGEEGGFYVFGSSPRGGTSHRHNFEVLIHTPNSGRVSS